MGAQRCRPVMQAALAMHVHLQKNASKFLRGLKPHRSLSTQHLRYEPYPVPLVTGQPLAGAQPTHDHVHL